MRWIEILIKVVLISVLILCLFKMPYGYYQLVRFVVPLGLLILAFGIEKKHLAIQMLFVGLAVLFQPLIKISLGREIWNIVDVTVAALLAVLVILDIKTMATKK